MRLPRPVAALVVLAVTSSTSAIYVPLREYAGSTFFDAWDFWGNVDNTTWGNVTYLDRGAATQQRLIYVNDAGHAIVRVDNTTNIAPATLVNRPSVRLTSKDSYGVGTLWIIDAIHIPYGCSVWPSFWTLGTGKEWPHAGEIDIIEGINLMNNNQMALHADAGCAQAANPGQSGKTLNGDCSQDRGCIVAETKPNSFGKGFADAGGGVFAVQMDVSGVYMWFWSRPEVPDFIKTATSTSNMDPKAFVLRPQQFVLLTTLCGDWAGVPNIYASTCPGHCINDNIIGPGSPKYDTAYWEIPYIRTYIANDQAPPPSSSTGSVSQVTLTSVVQATPSGGANASNGQGTSANGARRVDGGLTGVVGGAVSAVWMMWSLI
ncbi:putative glycoside hydrolase family 16 protein [Lyophyllum shimeji]|uniref:Glycoside hydrolase family 16 protein n=1 Tax=Lyophyllum shimeji TaxID=47721 RepID=A0A9P3PEF7_LYOSH|nr:putative glycoside hydrolase family 16 protein [Lyophyllum shimeji]